MSAEWYYHDGTKEHGPLLPRQLAELAARGVLRPGHRVRKGADGKWHLASQVKGLAFAATVQPVSSPAKPASPPPLPTHHDRAGPHARPIAVAEPGLSSHSITVIQPVVVSRAQNLGFVRQAAGHLQRLVRPPLRSYSIAAACGLAVVLVVTVAMMLGHSSRPSSQASMPQVTDNNKADVAFHQGETAHREKPVLAANTQAQSPHLSPAATLLQTQDAADDPTLADEIDPKDRSAGAYCARGNAYFQKNTYDKAMPRTLPPFV